MLVSNLTLPTLLTIMTLFFVALILSLTDRWLMTYIFFWTLLMLKLIPLPPQTCKFKVIPVLPETFLFSVFQYVLQIFQKQTNYLCFLWERPILMPPFSDFYSITVIHFSCILAVVISYLITVHLHLNTDIFVILAHAHLIYYK